MILMVEQKSGEIRLSESFEQQMNNFIVDLQMMKVKGSDSISRDLKVRVLVDSSGNWELQLLDDWAFLPFRTAPSPQ